MQSRIIISLLILCVLATAALAAEPIKIGGLFDLTGKAQNVGITSRDVARMIVDRINLAGGVNGRKIELVIADAQSDPSQAAIALQRLIQKDNVIAVIGPTTTGAAMACLHIAETAHVPMVACVGGDAPVEPAHQWVFKTPQKTSTAVAKLFSYMQAHHIANIGLLGAADKFGQEGNAMLKKLAGNYHITIHAEESFNPTDVDMTVPLSKVAAAHPQAIVVWTIGPAGAIIAKNAKAARITIPLFQCHGQPDADYLKFAGEAANGTTMPATKLMLGAQLPKDDPQRAGVLEFIKEFNARHIGEVGTHSGYAWDAVQIVYHALKAAGTNPEALRKAIENTKNYVGVSGIYNMSPTDHCGLAENSMVMVRVENGKWVPAK